MKENHLFEEEKKEESGLPIFDLKELYTSIYLNWQWFIVSVILCLLVAFTFLRYTTPIYNVSAKMLIKEEERTRRTSNSLQTSAITGTISNSTGLRNEIEIINSHDLSAEVIRDLKLYTQYFSKGRIQNKMYYTTQPISVDIDPASLDRLESPINLQITREGNSYHITGSYTLPVSDNKETGPFEINKTIAKLPENINTRAGVLTFSSNGIYSLEEGETELVSIQSPSSLAYNYVGAFSITPNPDATTIAMLSINDQIPQRAQDYLRQLVVVYNRQANDDKNEIARRTEEFINSRLEKINAELGATEGALESFKRRNNIIQVEANAGQAMGNANEYDQKLHEANTQVALLNSISDYMNQSGNKYQTLPSNVGLSDQSATELINKYNELVLERNRRLNSASETSPVVTTLTTQLDELTSSIRRAMSQARKSLDIQRNSIASQFGKYQGQISSSPEQERIMTQIGRQQDVKSGLYLMLLQKREENSISLAATADKGRLIDAPSIGGQISPKPNTVWLIAIIIGLALPLGIIVLLQLLHYKIEGRKDVEKLTSLPILADVAVANDSAKTRGDIVVHENKNNQMEEIFRSIRTNLQFMITETQKVIMFTSTTSGEGKTFNAANLAVSFALLNKKVILVGLDIRKPRLAELFEIDNHHNGITNLLGLDTITKQELHKEIISSEVNNNLDLLMSGAIPPNPAELVARHTLDEVINMLKEEYDYIIIDTAPIGLVTDTMQIGRVADATVYVCRADYTPKDSFVFINKLAAEKKLPNMSLIINGIDMSKKKHSYYYGYGKYGKYGRYGHYGKHSSYGSYGAGYGNYANSHYGDKNDTSIKQ